MELALTSSYPSPVNQLLTYGETGSLSPDKWPNYLELGLGPEHIPGQVIKARQEHAGKPKTRWLNSHARKIANGRRTMQVV